MFKRDEKEILDRTVDYTLAVLTFEPLKSGGTQFTFKMLLYFNKNEEEQMPLLSDTLYILPFFTNKRPIFRLVLECVFTSKGENPPHNRGGKIDFQFGNIVIFLPISMQSYCSP